MAETQKKKKSQKRSKGKSAKYWARHALGLTRKARNLKRAAAQWQIHLDRVAAQKKAA